MLILTCVVDILPLVRIVGFGGNFLLCLVAIVTIRAISDQIPLELLTLTLTLRAISDQISLELLTLTLILRAISDQICQLALGCYGSLQFSDSMKHAQKSNMSFAKCDLIFPIVPYLMNDGLF